MPHLLSHAWLYECRNWADKYFLRDRVYSGEDQPENGHDCGILHAVLCNIMHTMGKGSVMG